jgi:hypothetical protein
MLIKAIAGITLSKSEAWTKHDGATGLKYHPKVDPRATLSVRSQAGLAATAISRKAVCQVSPALSHGVRSSTCSVRLSHLSAATCSITACSPRMISGPLGRSAG